MTRVDGVLVDVKAITARVGDRAERVDSAIQHTIDRVDRTTGRVRESVVSRVGSMVTAVQGIANLVGGILGSRRSSDEPPVRFDRDRSRNVS
jgi:hypothetical protein